jgi:hypothetical protein
MGKEAGQFFRVQHFIFVLLLGLIPNILYDMDIIGFLTVGLLPVFVNSTRNKDWNLCALIISFVSMNSASS